MNRRHRGPVASPDRSGCDVLPCDVLERDGDAARVAPRGAELFARVRAVEAFGVAIGERVLVATDVELVAADVAAIGEDGTIALLLAAPLARAATVTLRRWRTPGFLPTREREARPVGVVSVPRGGGTPQVTPGAARLASRTVPDARPNPRFYVIGAA